MEFRDIDLGIGSVGRLGEDRVGDKIIWGKYGSVGKE